MASAINGTNIVLYEYDSNAIYYFNGGTAQGTFDSIVCKELSRSQVAGTSVDFTKTGAGTIASFITDALDPGVTTIPAGTWTFSAYYSILTAFAGAQVQYELYKYNGSVATLLFTSAATTLTALAKTLYSTAMTVTQTTIAATDRLLIKVIYAGTTTNQITLYTQSSNPAEVTTTIPLGTPFGASTNCTFNTSVDQVEITTLATGSYKEYIGSQINWDVSVDGLIALSGYSYLSLLSKLQNKESIEVRFSIDNDNGDGTDTYGYSIIAGTCNIVSLDINGPMENASSYSANLQGTGAYSITGTQVIDGGSTISTSSVNSFSYIAVGGETSVTFAGAIGSTCISVTRGGVEVRAIATSGTPTDENVSFNSATGVLTFATARPLEVDEFVRMITKIIN
jgi:predicted secreted protein